MDPQTLPRLDIEPTFDRVVRLAGGLRVDELVGENPSFETADYYFETDGVVAELKVIETDDVSDSNTRAKIKKLYLKWVDQGLVPPPPPGNFMITLSGLPESLRLDFIKPFRSRLQGPVKKAARQIKQTKVAFQIPDALGLLILVNDTNRILTPDTTFNLLSHLLKKDHSEIHHVIYCTVNLPVLIDGRDITGPFWSSLAIDGRKELPPSFLDKLARCWTTILDDSYGVHFPTASFPDGEITALASLKFDTKAEDRRTGLFVRQGEFYRSRRLGYCYYCDAVINGTAHFYLVESFQNGQLIQAIFDQKVIWSSDYELINDRLEQDRLSVMLKKMKRVDRGRMGRCGC